MIVSMNMASEQSAYNCPFRQFCSGDQELMRWRKSAMRNGTARYCLVQPGTACLGFSAHFWGGGAGGVNQL
jgi:hypothetical protein